MARPGRAGNSSPYVRISRACAIMPAAVLAGTLPAAAHMPVGGNALYGGILHPLSGIETILLLASFGMLAGLMPERHLFRALAGFLGGILAGGFVGLLGAGGDALGPFVAVNLAVTGGIVAADGVPKDALEGWAMPTLCALLGLVYGAANVVPLPADWSPPAYFLGVVLVAAFIANLAAQLTARAVAGWRRIAVRVLGSWVAATGLITAMLAVLTA